MSVTLLLPRRRLWRWHAVLVDELRARGPVAVRLVDSKPYPLALRLWLAAERRLFGPSKLAAPVGPEAFAAASAGEGRGENDILIDLTEDAAEGHALTLRFDGAREEAALFAALQGGRSPRLEVVDARGDVCAASYPAVEVRDELGRSLGFVHARLIALVLRACVQASSPAVAPPPSDAKGRATLPGFIAASAGVKLRAKLTGGRSVQEDWRIAIRRAPASTEELFGASGFAPLANPPGVFHADPFLFEHDGRTLLFVEAFPWATRKGVIACATLEADGRPGPFETVLEEDIHLSYPQVFAHQGEIYMLPETASARRLQLYRTVQFPRRWERVAVMLEGLRIADATLLQHGGLWWLFASLASHGGASQDEVFAWSGPSIEGPWEPHPLNPLVSDVRSGRPGGRFVRRGDRLFRPAQDGKDGYGAGLAWCEVEALTPLVYRETLAARWRGPDFGPYTGVHSFSEAGGWQAIDLKSPRGQIP